MTNLSQPIYQTNTVPVDQIIRHATLETITVTAPATTGTATPPPNTDLHEFGITMSSNATTATAGIVTVTLSLNGEVIRVSPVWVPATQGSGSNRLMDTNAVPLSDISFPVGAAGTLDVTISPALTAGTVHVNAYFA